MTQHHTVGVPPSRMAWRCLTCGTVADGLLTDETTCKCTDAYDQQWVKVDDSAGIAGVNLDGGKSHGE